MATAVIESVTVVQPSRRQLDILSLHAQGMTFREISETIYLSERTIRWHLDSLRSRLGARSLSNAVVICVARGYMCIDGRTGKPFVPDEFELIAA